MAARPDDRIERIAEMEALAWEHQNRAEQQLEELRVESLEVERASREYDRVVEAFDLLVEELRAEVTERIKVGHTKLDGLAVELAAQRVRAEALRQLLPRFGRAARVERKWSVWHKRIAEQRENSANRRLRAALHPDWYPPGHEGNLGKREYRLSR